MSTKKLITIISLLLLVLVGGTYFLSVRDKAEDNQVPSDNNQSGSVLPADAMRINAKHSFEDGRHIVAGEVEVPTPCHSLSVSSSIAESSPEQVTISFSTSTGDEMCAQVISSRRFKIEFNASEQASIRANWNGVGAILNLIPALPGEDLDNFDIYIKG